MAQLVAFYESEPVKLQAQLELAQEPLPPSGQVRSSEGAVRAGLVYLSVPATAGRFVVPFADYEEWLLRDQYNEAIRMMNTLGASVIECETFRTVKKRRGFRARVRGQGVHYSRERVQDSGFDFKHIGAGSPARDPRPLRWPDEPGFTAAVSSVLENGSTEVVINIKSNHRYDVEGSLGVTLRGLGFELGGNSSTDGEKVLHIRAQFPPPRQGWLANVQGR